MASTPSTRRRLDGVAVWSLTARFGQHGSVHPTHWLICSQAPKIDAPSFKAPSFDMPKAPSFDMPKAPSFEMPKLPDAPKVDAPSFDMPKFDAPKVEAPKMDMPKFDAPSMPSFSVRISAKLKLWRRVPAALLDHNLRAIDATPAR